VPPLKSKLTCLRARHLAPSIIATLPISGNLFDKQPILSHTGKKEIVMRIVSRATLKEFWEQSSYSDSEQPLKAWYEEAKKRLTGRLHKTSKINTATRVLSAITVLYLIFTATNTDWSLL
jgi:hypothetical protein